MRHIGLACAFVRLCGGKRLTLATKNCIYIRRSSCVSTSDRSVDFTSGRCKVHGHFPPEMCEATWYEQVCDDEVLQCTGETTVSHLRCC